MPAPASLQDVPSGLCQLPWPGTCNRPCSDVLPGDKRLPTSGKPQARRRGKRAVTFNAGGTVSRQAPHGLSYFIRGFRSGTAVVQQEDAQGDC